MKTFARILNIIFYILEGISVFAILFGYLFKYLHLEGDELLQIAGFFLIAGVYFLIAFTPYYKKYISTDAIFEQGTLLLFRRSFYFILGWLVLTDLFYSLNLDGKELLAIIIVPISIIMLFFSIIRVAIKSERRLVLQGVLIRSVIFLILFFVLWVSKPTSSLQTRNGISMLVKNTNMGCCLESCL
jgi:hypothetical protein